MLAGCGHAFVECCTTPCSPPRVTAHHGTRISSLQLPSRNSHRTDNPHRDRQRPSRTHLVRQLLARRETLRDWQRGWHDQALEVYDGLLWTVEVISRIGSLLKQVYRIPRCEIRCRCHDFSACGVDVDEEAGLCIRHICSSRTEDRQILTRFTSRMKTTSSRPAQIERRRRILYILPVLLNLPRSAALSVEGGSSRRKFQGDIVLARPERDQCLTRSCPHPHQHEQQPPCSHSH